MRGFPSITAEAGQDEVEQTCLGDFPNPLPRVEESRSILKRIAQLETKLPN